MSSKYKPTVAMYPGTFDPVTNGHTDLVDRATRLFDLVIVAVAASSSKAPLFTTDQRRTLLSAVLKDYATVSVVSFDGLLVEFMRRQNCKILLRGLRAVSDFEYEFQLASMNRSLYPEMDTVFLTPHEKLMFISASLVREVASLGGDVSPFVHPLVNEAIVEKLNGGQIGGSADH